jgi:hypothetical protein
MKKYDKDFERSYDTFVSHYEKETGIELPKAKDKVKAEDKAKAVEKLRNRYGGYYNLHSPAYDENFNPEVLSAVRMLNEYTKYPPPEMKVKFAEVMKKYQPKQIYAKK